MASSLLFVIASNIDKQPSPFEKVVKPSYRFFNSIFGVAGGCIAVITTTITINYLASSRVDDHHNFDYFASFHILLAHDYYMVILELSMIVASGFGFYYFSKIVQPLEKPMLLDVILLSICLIGPIASDMFSLVSVISGNNNKIPGWLITLSLPIVDIFQCVFQFTLILYGLKREPLPSGIVQQAAENLRFNVVSELKQHNIICTTNTVAEHPYTGARGLIHCRSSYSFSKQEEDGEEEEDEEETGENRSEMNDVVVGDLLEWKGHYHRRRASSYMRHTRTSVVSAMVSIANPTNMYRHQRGETRLVATNEPRRGVRHSVCGPVSNHQGGRGTMSTTAAAQRQLTNSSVPSLAKPGDSSATRRNGSTMTGDGVFHLETPPDEHMDDECFTNDDGVSAGSANDGDDQQESVLKFVTETQIARPMGKRTRLRNVIMYLLISNACLWVFLSLEGTAFDTHPYQLSYYGASAWTTILMICRPLIIFFRMHSAGCLFEIWSYA